MSDEVDAANDAASDGGDNDDNASSGARTAVVTKAAVRPQRPSGKRSRQRIVESDEDEDGDESTGDAKAEITEAESATKNVAKSDTKSSKGKTPTGKTPAGKTATGKTAKSKTALKGGGKAKPKKAGSGRASTVNPIMFVYNYLKQVVAEMRKVIWPNRKQMITYTSVVLVFLAFMVALVGGTDLGLSKLVLWVFG